MISEAAARMRFDANEGFKSREVQRDRTKAIREQTAAWIALTEAIASLLERLPVEQPEEKSERD